jgi:hypothetical protein
MAEVDYMTKWQVLRGRGKPKIVQHKIQEMVKQLKALAVREKWVADGIF